MLVGVGANRPDKAWTHLYRSLQHGDAKNACKAVRNLGFPPGIVTCADAFVTLQQERHDADYDPDHRVLRADAIASYCFETLPKRCAKKRTARSIASRAAAALAATLRRFGEGSSKPCVAPA
jgi:GH24 family phage-related lysozyme (muramidase)